MEQTNKLNWIKKVTPLLYSLSLAGICLYIAFRCRSWANLLLPWETGFFFFPLAAADVDFVRRPAAMGAALLFR